MCVVFFRTLANQQRRRSINFYHFPRATFGILVSRCNFKMLVDCDYSIFFFFFFFTNWVLEAFRTSTRGRINQAAFIQLILKYDYFSLTNLFFFLLLYFTSCFWIVYGIIGTEEKPKQEESFVCLFMLLYSWFSRNTNHQIMPEVITIENKNS